jgi:hypothetical protein
MPTCPAIKKYSLSRRRGEYIVLDSQIYITHSGLLRIATFEGCAGISVLPVLGLCDAGKGRWVFKATVYRQGSTLGFDGVGDADPTNVSALVLGAELRVAETRAVNRALRKAYGVGLCSIEELGARPTPGSHNTSRAVPTIGSASPLRNELQRLVQQHQLDPSLVKRYAADFCGTACLREARRELVEGFIQSLSESINDDKAALLRKLNTYRESAKDAA